MSAFLEAEAAVKAGTASPLQQYIYWWKPATWSEEEDDLWLAALMALIENQPVPENHSMFADNWYA